MLRVSLCGVVLLNAKFLAWADNSPSTLPSHSLFLSTDEVEACDIRRDPLHGPATVSSGPLVKTLTLDAILFQAPLRWTIWLNGICISSDDPRQIEGSLGPFAIQKVDEQSVTLLIKGSQVVKLIPGKIYVLP